MKPTWHRRGDAVNKTENKYEKKKWNILALLQRRPRERERETMPILLHTGTLAMLASSSSYCIENFCRLFGFFSSGSCAFALRSESARCHHRFASFFFFFKSRKMCCVGSLERFSGADDGVDDLKRRLLFAGGVGAAAGFFFMYGPRQRWKHLESDSRCLGDPHSCHCVIHNCLKSPFFSITAFYNWV